MTTSLPILLSLTLASAVVPAGESHGQESVDPRTSRVDPGWRGADAGILRLQPVDQGVGDVTTLGTSLRLLDAGLRMPTGFARVFPVPGRPGWHMRVDGGLYAVFQNSIYVQDGAPIPNDTVFYIGRPAFMSQVPFDAGNNQPMQTRLLGSPLVQTNTLRPAGDMYSQSPRTAPDTEAPEPPDNPTMVHDGPYRRSRLIALMEQAATIAQDRARKQLRAAPESDVALPRKREDS